MGYIRIVRVCEIKMVMVECTCFAGNFTAVTLTITCYPGHVEQITVLKQDLESAQQRERTHAARVVALERDKYGAAALLFIALSPIL